MIGLETWLSCRPRWPEEIGKKQTMNFDEKKMVDSHSANMVNVCHVKEVKAGLLLIKGYILVDLLIDANVVDLVCIMQIILIYPTAISIDSITFIVG